MSKIEITEELLCKIEAAAEEALAIHPAPWTIERDQVRDANRALVGAPDVPRGVPVILYVGTLAPEVALALCAELRKEWEEAHRAWMNRREETERSDRLFTAFRWRMRCPLCGGTWDNTGYMDCPRPGTFRCPRCFGEIPYEDLEQWKVGTMKIRKREPGPGTIHFGDEVAKLREERDEALELGRGIAERLEKVHDERSKLYRENLMLMDKLQMAAAERNAYRVTLQAMALWPCADADGGIHRQCPDIHEGKDDWCAPCRARKVLG